MSETDDLAQETIRGDGMSAQTGKLTEKTAAVFGGAALLVMFAQGLAGDGSDWTRLAMSSAGPSETASHEADRKLVDVAAGGHDSVYAFFVGNPIYYRSTFDMQRPDGTDLSLRGLGWDGDALHFPIDGGVR